MAGRLLPRPCGAGRISASATSPSKGRGSLLGALAGSRPIAPGSPKKAFEDDDIHSQCSTKVSTSCGDRDRPSIGTLVGDLPSSLASPCSSRRSSHSSAWQPDVRIRSWELKDFNVIKTVGKGFLGSVRVVELADGSDSTPFALKVMKKSVVIRKKQVNHTMQEKNLLGQVDNPFIVQLRAAFQDSANLYLLMEFVNGGELFTAVRNGLRFKNDGAKFYASEIALALGHCHGRGIAYRDLKLENVLVDRSGHVKIADFGFAKIVGRSLTYTLCGTPDYQAPEIILGHGHDMSVDWWALGVLIFELFTGKTPFGASDSKAIYEKTLFGEPRYPSFFTANCQNITSRFLEKDRRFRLGFGSAGFEDVKHHPWLASVDFEFVLQKQYQPPYLPTVATDRDTCMFDPWPEEDIRSSDSSDLTAEQQLLFKDF